MNHYAITVSGKVQGVFFRASAKASADALGVFGFARNQSDGTVYIEAEGEDAALEKFVTWCKTGPPMSSVSHCEIVKGPLKHFTSFVILR